MKHWPQRVLMGLVRAYRLLLSPSLGSSCRFFPSCSAYALQSLEQHGAAAGSYLTLSRLLRCHPWCQPGVDEVPACPPRFFTRLISSTNRSPALATAPRDCMSLTPSEKTLP